MMCCQQLQVHVGEQGSRCSTRTWEEAIQAEVHYEFLDPQRCREDEVPERLQFLAIR